MVITTAPHAGGPYTAGSIQVLDIAYLAGVVALFGLVALIARGVQKL
ncbi:hypothetical protein [Subtercola sp. YIM 133946]